MKRTRKPQATQPWTLGDDIRERAREWRGAADEHQWAIGDFLNEQWTAAPKRHRLSVLNILASDAGLGKSTGRLYRKVSATFPPGSDARDMCAERVATWTHASVAVRAPDPMAALVWSADQFATVDQLRVRVKELKQGKAPTLRERIKKELTAAHRHAVAAANLASGAKNPNTRGRAFIADTREAANDLERLLATLEG